MSRKIEWVGFGCVKFEMFIKYLCRDVKKIDYIDGIKERGLC